MLVNVDITRTVRWIYESNRFIRNVDNYLPYYTVLDHETDFVDCECLGTVCRVWYLLVGENKEWENGENFMLMNL
jgi:hypothetical protein